MAAVRSAKKLWPMLLALLSDPLPGIRKTAAVAVGQMGAIATMPVALENPAPGRHHPMSLSQGCKGPDQNSEAAQPFCMSFLPCTSSLREIKGLAEAGQKSRSLTPVQ